jgi:hypothetical protein
MSDSDSLSFDVVQGYKADCGCSVSMVTCQPLQDFKAPFVTGAEHPKPGLPVLGTMTHNRDGTCGLYVCSWVYGKGQDQTCDEFPNEETAKGYISAIFELKLWKDKA